MDRLSQSIDHIAGHYDVVVVGSGYGGAITASRLSRAGLRVCVLERGRELLPGEYPKSPNELLPQVQITSPHELNPMTMGTEAHSVGNELGLFNFHVQEELSVLVGCGLGGTSLINASVSLRPETSVFQDPVWPAPLRAHKDGQLPESLERCYERAERMLGANLYPDAAPPLPKQAAHQRSAKALHAEFRKVPLNVTFEDRVNEAGLFQPKCNNCGDCVSGCNYGAKNTVLMNYLPDARNFGAAIFTEVRVSRVSRAESGRGYRVHYQQVSTGHRLYDAPDSFVTADLVVLAAGTLGTTEILLRSRARGLPTSGKLGARFSGNGDMLAFSYNGEQKTHAVGAGTRTPDAESPVGPCITSMIDLRKHKGPGASIIEEGVIPGALDLFLPPSFTVVSKAVGVREHHEPELIRDQRLRERQSMMAGAYEGAVSHTQTYLLMTDDDADGSVRLGDDDILRIHWPGVGNKPAFQHAAELLSKVATALRGIYVKNPIWTQRLRNSLITVHPLGGCALADSAEHGVVNHKGQVYSGLTGVEVHEGLYVADGALIPRSLGVNPLLTISALAEHIAEGIAHDRGLTIDWSTRAVPPQKAIKPGIRFSETMHGHFLLGETESFARGDAAGRKSGSSFRFVLTIQSGDLEAMLNQPDHPGKLAGTVLAPALHPRPLVVPGGLFNLFVNNPREANTRNMRYRFPMLAEDGKQYFLDGYKVIHKDTGFDIWTDTTTLFITLYEGVDDSGRMLGKGILRLTPKDVTDLTRTMQVLDVVDPVERMKWLARFGACFAGTLFEIYGPLAGRGRAISSDEAPRHKRALRAGSPEFHEARTGDNNRCLLSRYHGGDKGPVVLSYGIGASSQVFALDTVRVTLLEYLYQAGYDVWLLDDRSSPLLPEYTEYSFDEIAHHDLPAALALVRTVSGRDVHVFAHGLGGLAFTMAATRGLSGIRSAVLSQAAAHLVVPRLKQIQQRLPSLPVAQAVSSRLAGESATAKLSWKDRLLHAGLDAQLAPVGERCKSTACHRLSFLYGPLFHHDRLDAVTHASLEEVFGEVSLHAIEHQRAMISAGHLVSAASEDLYLPQLSRLAFPITFLHGEKNERFLPESTAVTLAALEKLHDPRLYERKVIAGYGDTDCLLGKHAFEDVFPFIREHLEKHA